MLRRSRRSLTLQLQRSVVSFLNLFSVRQRQEDLHGRRHHRERVMRQRRDFKPQVCEAWLLDRVVRLRHVLTGLLQTWVIAQKVLEAAVDWWVVIGCLQAGRLTQDSTTPQSLYGSLSNQLTDTHMRLEKSEQDKVNLL